MLHAIRRGGAAAALILFGCAGVANAQQEFVYWPNPDYDSSVPTVEEVLGYATGERITWHRDAIRYFRALEAAEPDRVRVVPYASSWEGRELIYVIVTSAENMARIDDVKAGMQRLADPRQTSSDDAASIIANQPAVTWLSYGVHGNEISSTDASMLTAYHLLASRGDSRSAEILRDTVVVIDPMQNPDGRDRFIQHYHEAEGLVPDGDRLSAEQNERWPGGRTNHYLFDLNRDWFILTQPETRGRVAALQEWYPVAYVDAHEMGSDNTYYFAPEAVPYNPHLAADQRASLELFGRTNARWFDRFGIDYFTREVYDAFYPGYGASWPSYFGSIAMTYEQASAGGLVFRQYDGNEMSYAYTVRNHFLTSMGTAETVQANREKFLGEFYDYRVTAIEEGRSDSIRAYVVPTQTDQAAADKLAGLLVAQGVEVGRATGSFNACGNSYDAGSYIINTAQPAKRLIRTLLDEDVPIEAGFLEEQEARRARNVADQIYDVTAWSLPMMLNIRADTCSRAVNTASVPAGPELIQPGEVSGASGSVAYLVPWTSAASTRFLAAALTRGLKVKSNDLAFTHMGNRYPAGTLIIDVADNPSDIASTVTELARMSGADVVAVDDSWVTDGPNFGSGNVVRFSTPRVAIAWDTPTSSYSAGNTRFVIERQFGFPVTAIRTAQLGSADLHRYHVLILPSQGRRCWLRLVRWVKAGIDNLRRLGRPKVAFLIGIGTAAMRFLTDPDVDMLAIRREDAVYDLEIEEPPGGRRPTKTIRLHRCTGRLITGRIRISSDADRCRKEDNRRILYAGVLDSCGRESRSLAGRRRRKSTLTRSRTWLRTSIRPSRSTTASMWRDSRAPTTCWPAATSGKRTGCQLALQAIRRRATPAVAAYVIGFTQDPNVRAYLDGSEPDPGERNLPCVGARAAGEIETSVGAHAKRPRW